MGSSDNQNNELKTKAIATITAAITSALNDRGFVEASKIANQLNVSEASLGIKTAAKLAAAKIGFAGILAAGFSGGPNGASAAAFGTLVGLAYGPVAGSAAALATQEFLDHISNKVRKAIGVRSCLLTFMGQKTRPDPIHMAKRAF